ncbi:FecCD family ABC transporter permease [Gephyromycinifex aptenodytis]|uniref:FecCD family ABC transporter permease n=1 Tax=Gephyromycinifex aptenodytis TaxID=2716227 RepID=UPI001D004D82|nr:iron chelate uptake ABC transporter family permease subunit [Gephyromycinifex aptenodytis]
MVQREGLALHHRHEEKQMTTAVPQRQFRQQRCARSGLFDQRRRWGIPALCAALLIAVTLSIAYGANPIPVDDVWTATVRPGTSEASSIVWSLRMPRTFVGIAAGTAFGVAGALIQALTRNPLADPGILGVNAGSAFAITVGVGVFGITSIGGLVWFSFLGAIVSTVLVYTIGSAGRGSASPVTLVLAGVALAAVFTALSTFMVLIDRDTFRAVRSWGLGSIARTTVAETLVVVPFLALGLLLVMAIANSLNAVALGDDQAVSLGAHVQRTRVVGLVAVTLLAGGATALTGGIAFVGLAVPHMVRWFTGPDQRWILFYTAIASPSLVLAADVLGRVIARPGEIEAGVLTALIGAPVLITLVRSTKAAGL